MTTESFVPTDVDALCECGHPKGDHYMRYGSSHADPDWHPTACLGTAAADDVPDECDCEVFQDAPADPPHGTYTLKDETYWSGMVDLENGRIVQSFSYTRAASCDFDVDLITTEQGALKFRAGEWAYFWVTQDGFINGEDRFHNDLPGNIVLRIVGQAGEISPASAEAA